MGSVVSTDVHLDNYEIRKIGTILKFSVGQSTALS